MVDMGMAENKVVDVGGIEPQVAIHGIGLQPFSLVHAAVKQYFQTIMCGYQMFATRHFAGGTHKL